MQLSRQMLQVTVKVMKGVMMILDPQRHRMAEVSDSDINDDDDDDDDDGGCSKNNDLRILEQFIGNSGLTFTPDDPTSISEIVNCFLRNHFLEICVEQSDLCHAQNSDKCKSSSVFGMERC
jgi:hypothetical protein